MCRSEEKLRNAALSVLCCFVFPCKLSIEGMQNFNCNFASTSIQRPAVIFDFYEIFVAKEDRITALSDRLRWRGVFLVINILM